MLSHVVSFDVLPAPLQRPFFFMTIHTHIHTPEFKSIDVEPLELNPDVYTDLR